MKIINCGDSAILLELANVGEAITAADLLRSANLVGVAEVHASGNSVLVTSLSDAKGSPEAAVRTVLAKNAQSFPSLANATSTVTLPVTYNGADAEKMANLFHTSASDLTGWHADTEWVAEVCADEPGLWYLSAVGTPLVAPPQEGMPKIVPAGTVLSGQGYTAVHRYGGQSSWYVIGHIANLAAPATQRALDLLEAGVSVSFERAESILPPPQHRTAGAVPDYA